MGRSSLIGIAVGLVAVLVQSSCIYYPTVRTFYEPNADDGKVLRTGCEYLTTHNTIERVIGGATLTIGVGEDNIAAAHPETVDVHIRAIYEGTDMVIDPALVSISAEGEGSEIHGMLLAPMVSKAEWGFQDKAGRVWQSIYFDVRYPLAAGQHEALSLRFRYGALRLSGQAQDIRPFRFSRVRKRDVFYGSINC